MIDRFIARRASVAAATLATAGLLAGCAEELPVPDPEPGSIGAVVTQEQEKTIISRVAASIETAVEEKDVKGLDARMAGPAKKVRASQIEVAKKLDSDDHVTELLMTMQSITLPSDPEWPRTSLTVSTPPGDSTPPTLYTFQQADARSDYKLWGWADLLPGLTLPHFASTDAGAEEVAADDDKTLAVSPAKAISMYASVLSDDKDSEFADAVQDDDFRDFLRKQESAQTKADGWKESEGKYSFSAKADEKAGVQGMRTVDGGAIVMGVVNSTQLIKLQDKAEAPPSSGFVTQKTLFGDKDVTNVLRTKYLDMVALYVPPAGSEDPLYLVGFEHVAVDATNE